MLNNTICGSVAFSIKSPNFSTFKQAWKGSWSSEPARDAESAPKSQEEPPRAFSDRDESIQGSEGASTRPRTLNNNVREVQQVDLQGVEHALARDDDLLGLLFHR